jgi:hypothetical protein
MFSQQGSVWFAGEGDVRPEGWMFARAHDERDSLVEERTWAAFALVSLVAAALLAVATYLEEPTSAPKPAASVAVVEATASVDSKERVARATQAAGHSVDRVVADPVRITKIAFDPPGNDLPVTNRKLNREYVTLKNTSRSVRWLTGWILKDKNIDGHSYRFQRFRIRPGRYVRIHTGSGRNDRNDLYWNADNYIWNNFEREKATLKRPGGIVDSCRYPASASSPKKC